MKHLQTRRRAGETPSLVQPRDTWLTCMPDRLALASLPESGQPARRRYLATARKHTAAARYCGLRRVWQGWALRVPLFLLDTVCQLQASSRAQRNARSDVLCTTGAIGQCTASVCMTLPVCPKMLSTCNSPTHRCVSLADSVPAGRHARGLAAAGAAAACVAASAAVPGAAAAAAAGGAVAIRAAACGAKTSSRMRFAAVDCVHPATR